MRIRLIGILTGALIVALAGGWLCACSDATSTHDAGQTDIVNLCQQDAHCPPGHYCDDGVCKRALILCDEQGLCPEGMECRNGGCVPVDSPDGGTDGGEDGGDEAAPGPDIEVVSPELSDGIYELNFGNVMVGVTVEQQVVLTNTGDENLQILNLNFESGTDLDDFAIPAPVLDSLPIVIAPGAEQTLDVVYTATDGITDHCVLDIISNDPDEALVQIHLLSEFKGDAAARLAPAALDFGDVPVGTSGAPLTLTLSNAGSGNAVLTVEEVRLGILANEDFDLALLDADGQPVDALPALLNNADFIDVQVTYHPQLAEEDSDQVVAVTDDALQPTLRADLTGRGVIGDVTADPSPVDMGRVRVGHLQEQAVSLTNSGGASLELTGVALSGTSAEWTLASSDLQLDDLATNPHPLEPGESVSVTLGFGPVDVGVETGHLQIDHSGPGQTLEVSLRAEGYIPAAITLNPAPPLVFADAQYDQPTGRSSPVTVTLTIGNTGGEDLQVQDLRLATPNTEFSWTNEPSHVPPDQDRSFGITFRPQAAGTRTNVLVFDTNDPDVAYDGVPGRVGVDLQANALDPAILVSPSTPQDFGDVSIGSQGLISITIFSASNDPLFIHEVRLGSGGSSDFGLANLPNPAVPLVGLGASHVFQVLYDPLDQGPDTGAVEILSSDIGNPLITIALSGRSSGCPDGWGDCYPGTPGCETQLNSTSHCGACGNTCVNPHGTTSCQNGVCTPVCQGLWGVCGGDPDEGCLVPLNTMTDCGDCDAPCSLPHATASCSTGTCQVSICDDGWHDCNSNPGCETHTDVDEQHCGNCTTVCVAQNGTNTCIDGVCTPSCSANWGDCDGNPNNGCERATNTLTDCGGCNVACALAHASETCSSGSCQIVACDNGWCDLNGSPSNGCEHDLDTDPACSGATDIGTVRGDEGADTIDQYGRGEAWFRVRVDESSGGCDLLQVRLRLYPPNGQNYDLLARIDSCSGAQGYFPEPGDAMEQMYAYREDECILGIPTGSDQSFYVYINVIAIDVHTCDQWHLEIRGNP
ncbi:MAG: choice-of-anchor D domain-containing protein [Deltaproteobacteria bacterium]|nr:choice-of-anchor D domain-containing protein [Deltaproteobacteria bacterium]